MTKWRIDYHFIDNDGRVITNQFKYEYTDLDKAIEDYLTYVRVGGYGWYDLVEITEKVIFV